jgi:hypothetical protein
MVPLESDGAFCAGGPRALAVVRSADTRREKLLCGGWIRYLVAVGEGLQESDEGIFFLVGQLQVAELTFVEVG